MESDQKCKVKLREKGMEETYVSIWCTTYNHAAYIKDAIESFLAQRTQFKYEIIIYDDASTDGTTEIIEQYREKYPDRIKCLIQRENQYAKMKKSWKTKKEQLKSMSSGKYIAMCEGDDFWIDANKLQIQVDYLEKHPECVFTAHDALKFESGNSKIEAMEPYAEDKDVSERELIIQYRGNLPTVSTVFRREIIDLDGFFLEAGVGDYPLQLYALTKGKIHYFTRIMAVYRYFHPGSWHEKTMQDIDCIALHLLRMTTFLQNYNAYTEKKYETYVVAKIHKYFNQIIYGYQGFTVDAFRKKCTELDQKSNGIYQIYLEELQRIFQQIFDKDYCVEEILIQMPKYMHTVIWGSGRYGQIVARQLDGAGVPYDGFVVSDARRTENERCVQKTVWNLDQLPFPLKDTLVIVGINPVIWEELKSVMERTQMEHYICPFMLRESTDEA